MPALDPAFAGRVPQVASPQMNADHEQELRVLVEAAAAAAAFLDGSAAREDVLGAMAALYDQTRAHELREEQAMRAGGDPELASHQAAHERALAALDGAERRFAEDGDAEELRQFLVGRHLAWLEDHVGTFDHHAARFCQAWLG